MPVVARVCQLEASAVSGETRLSGCIEMRRPSELTPVSDPLRHNLLFAEAPSNRRYLSGSGGHVPASGVQAV